MSDEIFLRTYSVDMQQISDVKITTSGQTNNYVSLLKTSTGSRVLVWEQLQGSSYGIYCLESKDGAWDETKKQRIGSVSSASYCPKAVLMGDNIIAIAYTTGGKNIYCMRRRLSSSGYPLWLGPDVLIVSLSNTISSYYDLQWDSHTNSLFFIYLNDSNLAVLKRSMDQGKTWVTCSISGNVIKKHPQVQVTDSASNIHVAGFDTTTSKIVGQKIGTVANNFNYTVKSNQLSANISALYANLPEQSVSLKYERDINAVRVFFYDKYSIVQSLQSLDGGWSWS